MHSLPNRKLVVLNVFFLVFKNIQSFARVRFNSEVIRFFWGGASITNFFLYWISSLDYLGLGKWTCYGVVRSNVVCKRDQWEGTERKWVKRLLWAELCANWLINQSHPTGLPSTSHLPAVQLSDPLPHPRIKHHRSKEANDWPADRLIN